MYLYFRQESWARDNITTIIFINCNATLIVVAFDVCISGSSPRCWLMTSICTAKTELYIFPTRSSALEIITGYGSRALKAINIWLMCTKWTSLFHWNDLFVLHIHWWALNDIQHGIHFLGYIKHESYHIICHIWSSLPSTNNIH